MRYYWQKWIGVEFKVKLLIGLNRIGPVTSCLSDFTTLKCGLPQVTILGPLLLLIYINDLPDCLSFSLPRMYADDTHITLAGSDLHLIQSNPSHDLEKLRKWLVSYRLSFNATKTEFVLIGSRQRLSTLSDTLELSTDNVPIEQVPSVKSLGIYGYFEKGCRKKCTRQSRKVLWVALRAMFFKETWKNGTVGHGHMFASTKGKQQK